MEVGLHAGQAAARLLVVAGRTHTLLPRSLHTQEPGAPVQQHHARLESRAHVRAGTRGGAAWGGVGGVDMGG